MWVSKPSQSCCNLHKIADAGAATAYLGAVMAGLGFAVAEPAQHAIILRISGPLFSFNRFSKFKSNFVDFSLPEMNLRNCKGDVM